MGICASVRCERCERSDKRNMSVSVKFFARCVHVCACMKCVTRKGVNYRQIVFVCRGLVWTFFMRSASSVSSLDWVRDTVKTVNCLGHTRWGSQRFQPTMSQVESRYGHNKNDRRVFCINQVSVSIKRKYNFRRFHCIQPTKIITFLCAGWFEWLWYDQGLLSKPFQLLWGRLHIYLHTEAHRWRKSANWNVCSDAGIHGDWLQHWSNNGTDRTLLSLKVLKFELTREEGKGLAIYMWWWWRRYRLM